MRSREILGRKSARVEERECNRVAERERRRRRSGRRKPQRTGFGVDGRIEMHVCALGERALLIARECDDLRALTLQVRHQQHQLVGFTGIRQHHDDVVGRDHAEVAMSGFCGVHKKCRRTG